MRKLDHINIMVNDLDKSITFYIEKMGFSVVEHFKGTMEFVFITDGNVVYELIEKKEIAKGSFDHIAYASEDIDADFEHFKKLDVTMTEINYLPFLFDHGVKYFFVIGDTGERIEYIQKL